MNRKLISLFDAFSSWLCLLVVLLALLNWVLTAICLVMDAIDQGPEDHYWNCGVAIHGGLALIWSVLAAIYCFEVKDRWWKLPILHLRMLALRLTSPKSKP